MTEEIKIGKIHGAEMAKNTMRRRMKAPVKTSTGRMSVPKSQGDVTETTLNRYG